MATTAPTTRIHNPGTQREDNWWLEPLMVFGGLGAFAVYATFRALVGFGFTSPELSQLFINHHHQFAEMLGYAYYGNGAHYISPFASPDLSPILAPVVQPVNNFVRSITGWQWFVISPALWILWVPGGFRLTCYYYRKAYYRSFFASPPACAVGPDTSNPLGALLGRGQRYLGEKAFPMVMQNLHRYFFYISALFILILSIDALIGYFFKTADGGFQFGIRAGSIVLTLNALFLGLYTFSCHSWRHFLGGMIDNYSACGAVGLMRNHAWQRQSKLNEHHMLFAWISLVWVGFTDFYIWQVAQGNIPDITILPPVKAFTLYLPF
ncbi:MAG: succinate dehydrogenase [Candidatus Melainabacteria bacterium]